MKMLSHNKNEVDKFEILTKKIFQFLEKEYSFKIEKIERTKSGDYIYYNNEKIVIRISYVPIDTGIFLDFIEIKNFIHPKINDPIYDLLDIISIKDERYLNKIKQNYDIDLIYQEDYNTAKKVLIMLKEGLIRYGKEILEGDYSIFDSIKKIQDTRLKLHKSK